MKHVPYGPPAKILGDRYGRMEIAGVFADLGTLLLAGCIIKNGLPGYSRGVGGF